MIWALAACRATLTIPDEPDPPEASALVTLPEPPANLVLISMDTTRRDHVDRYATDGVVRTPFLASLLEESVVLDRFVQCSNWTFPSMHCSLTGTHLEEGTFFPRTGDLGAPVPDGQRTLARLLGEHGFTSVVASPNTYFSSETGNAQGYDVELYLPEATTTEVAAAALDALDPGAGRWFLHLHLYEPHAPYLPPPQHLGDVSALPDVPWDMSTALGQALATASYGEQAPDDQQAIADWLQAGYTGELRSMDAQLQDVWADLDTRGLLDDALVVFLTDHGEAFWEHGVQTHGWFLMREENDAVLAFWAHDLPPAAWDAPTHGVDLVPTVLEALDLPLPDGLSGFPVGLAPDDRPLFTATSAYGGPFQAVTLDDWRLLYGWGGLVRLWNLDADPLELEDLSAAEPERFDKLWALLEPRTELMQALVPEEAPLEP